MKSLNRSGTQGQARWMTPERPVAVLFRVGDHPEGVDVGELGKADRFALQLPPDRIGVLLAAEDPGRHIGGLEAIGRDFAGDQR